jgi:hypothetical protein
MYQDMELEPDMVAQNVFNFEKLTSVEEGVPKGNISVFKAVVKGLPVTLKISARDCPFLCRER